jgi:hypothetical protein
MNRISSTAVTVALAATLLVATAPAAQAREISKPRPAASAVTGGWFDAALAWLGGVLVSAPHGREARSTEKTTIYPTPIRCLSRFRTNSRPVSAMSWQSPVSNWKPINAMWSDQA